MRTTRFVLGSKVDEGRRRLDGVGHDQDALDQRVRVSQHDLAVLERPRLRLVGVAEEIDRLSLRVLRDESPLDARREPRASAAAQSGLLDRLNDRVMTELQLDGRTLPEDGRARAGHVRVCVLSGGVGGAKLAFGTDFPVESPDPFPGLFAATSRQDMNGQPPGGWIPSERLTFALRPRAVAAPVSPPDADGFCAFGLDAAVIDLTARSAKAPFPKVTLWLTPMSVPRLVIATAALTTALLSGSRTVPSTPCRPVAPGFPRPASGRSRWRSPASVGASCPPASAFI